MSTHPGRRRNDTRTPQRMRCATVASTICALALSACSGSESDPAEVTASDPAEQAILQDTAEVAKALDAAIDGEGLPSTMTGAWLNANGISLEPLNAVTWIDILGDGEGYRICLLNTQTKSWSEFNSEDGGLVGHGPSGGAVIGPECDVASRGEG